MHAKKLLIIGNKIGYPQYLGSYLSLDRYIESILNMDYVCRINRMHNYGVTTGTKTDGLYIGGWHDFIHDHKGGEHCDVTKTVPDIYVDARAWNGGFSNTCKQFITDLQYNNITVCTFEELKKHVGYNYPCSVILMIDYFATTKPWCDEYEVYVTGVDISDRSNVLLSGWLWLKNGHINGAGYELQYLLRMLNEGKIHWLDKELYEQEKQIQHVPILIPIKSRSVRCNYKNESLLPNTLEYIKSIGRINDVIIISDGNLFRHISRVYGVDYYVETRPNSGDEFTAIKLLLDSKKDITEFIWLPVTAPCRDLQLVDNVLQSKTNGLVTSYIKRPDRSIYKLTPDLQFDVKDTERKGCMCNEELIADGAIYYMSVEFFNKVYLSDNRNKAFWNSDICFVENKAPFVDIDTNNDLLLYLKYYKH